MGKTKELNIKNQTYYFYNNLINTKNFRSNFGYITIKSFGDCKNIHSVNPLYSLIDSAAGYFKEKYGEK